MVRTNVDTPGAAGVCGVLVAFWNRSRKAVHVGLPERFVATGSPHFGTEVRRIGGGRQRCAFVVAALLYEGAQRQRIRARVDVSFASALPDAEAQRQRTVVSPGRWI